MWLEIICKFLWIYTGKCTKKVNIPVICCCPGACTCFPCIMIHRTRNYTVSWIVIKNCRNKIACMCSVKCFRIISRISIVRKRNEKRSCIGFCSYIYNIFSGCTYRRHKVRRYFIVRTEFYLNKCIRHIFIHIKLLIHCRKIFRLVYNRIKCALSETVIQDIVCNITIGIIRWFYNGIYHISVTTVIRIFYFNYRFKPAYFNVTTVFIVCLTGV